MGLHCISTPAWQAVPRGKVQLLKIFTRKRRQVKGTKGMGGKGKECFQQDYKVGATHASVKALVERNKNV